MLICGNRQNIAFKCRHDRNIETINENWERSSAVKSVGDVNATTAYWERQGNCWKALLNEGLSDAFKRVAQQTRLLFRFADLLLRRWLNNLFLKCSWLPSNIYVYLLLKLFLPHKLFYHLLSKLMNVNEKGKRRKWRKTETHNHFRIKDNKLFKGNFICIF